MGGGGLTWLFPGQSLAFLVKNNFLSKNDRILDVGCGAGKLLFSLKENGFDKVLGIDPFINDTVRYRNGLVILKKTIHELADGSFNLIMFNHSFEHMSDPMETLVSAARLLPYDGVCLIRVPTVSSFAWEQYKEKWLILGAPYHFYIHSIESIRYMAERAGFLLDRVIYDSSVHQILPQEEFHKNILPHDKRSYNTGIKNYILNIPKIIKCQKTAEELNKKNQGETCAFVLKKQHIP
jgi:ubiquinone/menaquinone biosynthesis C-methylase UbiE